MQAWTEYARRLVALADHAHAARRMDVAMQASEVLLDLPPELNCEMVGSYYQAFCIARQKEFDQARAMFERVAEHAPLRFRAKAMMSLGGACHARGDHDNALSSYVEAGRLNKGGGHFDPLVAFTVHRMIAALKGEEGDHRRSLDDLERVFPLARMAGKQYPALLSDYLNSYAVELAAVGRLEEAGNVSRIVLASPYSNAYPEWRETADEIAERGLRPSRSIVAFCGQASTADNVVRVGEFSRAEESRSTEPRLCGHPSRVVDIQDWKRTHVPKEQKKPSKPRLTRQLSDLTPAEKRAALIRLIYLGDISEQGMEAILRFVADWVETDEPNG